LKFIKAKGINNEIMKRKDGKREKRRNKIGKSGKVHGIKV
jgi:hypothetical protein